ncbi:MAG: hypothetical protein WEB52_11190 [Dehalococcoidia bacterium]
MNDLVFRKARPEEFDDIAAIIYGHPACEEIAIAGDVDRARRWGTQQLRLRGLDGVHVGEMDGEIVVVVDINPAASPRGGVAILHRWKFELVRAAAWARVFGVRALPRFIALRRAEERVYPPLPEDAYHISEMTTTEKYRYSGIGAHARVYCEKEARRLGYKKMSLHTSVVNPAKDMVMRHGYALVATGTDAGYERLAGIAGWHLLVKELKDRATPPQTSITGDDATPG